MDQISGRVSYIIFVAKEGTFAVFSLEKDSGEEVTVTVKMRAPRVGDRISLEGKYVEHPMYGWQFTASYYTFIMPESEEEAIAFIERLQIRGLGNKSMELIREHFGTRLPDVLQHAPQEFLEVPKLRKSVAQTLVDTLMGTGAEEALHQFLERHALSSRWARPLFNALGTTVMEQIEDNPYILLRYCEGIRFSVVDTMARNMGFQEVHASRIEAGIFWGLAAIEKSGHTCYPLEAFMEKMDAMLPNMMASIVQVLEHLVIEGQVYLEEHEGIQYIYHIDIYEAEQNIVRYMNHKVLEETDFSMERIHSFLSDFEDCENVLFGESQRQAIDMIFSNRYSIVTGGPGTGKTTLIKAVVHIFETLGLSRITLCAPTGRAAKRLTEATQREATTIHRLLEPVGEEEYIFSKNEQDPIACDVLIIDEASMLNITLAHALWRALPKDVHVIMVGDVHQLPPIGSGCVLKDSIESTMIPTTHLCEIYRQKEGNAIIENAYAILQGSMPNLTSEREFIYIPVEDEKSLFETIISEYQKAMENVQDALEVQVICPMRQKKLGSESIARYMQNYLQDKEHRLVNDSKDDEVATLTIRGQAFSVGDKVIQNVNNYNLGVYNGEIGIIYALTKKALFVRFLDQEVTIPVEEAEGLSLAYAITVHKSQGSEYHTVLIPFVRPYGGMLQRNLLYTAVTRAKEKVIIIGSSAAIAMAVQTESERHRCTLLQERLREEV